MFTPTIWANPYELKHLKEKREIQRANTDDIKPVEVYKNQRTFIFDIFPRIFSLGRKLKLT